MGKAPRAALGAFGAAGDGDDVAPGAVGVAGRGLPGAALDAATPVSGKGLEGRCGPGWGLGEPGPGG